MAMLTQQRLKELLHYDPRTGVFTWTKNLSPRSRAKSGAVAGCVLPRGYRQIKLDGVRYLGHRLAWLYVNGHWPADEIDHIDGDPSNNVLSNLREANRTQNRANTRRKKNSVSGLKGVSWDITKRRWVARIGVGRRSVFLGTFNNKANAHMAYIVAARQYYGNYARAA